MYDEPFGDSSQIPTYLVSKLARNFVTVSLFGDGGDELFGGYNRYLLTKRIWQSLNRFPKSARHMAAGLIHAVPPSAFDVLYKCLEPIIPKDRRRTLVGERAHKLARFFSADGPGSVYLGTLSQCEDPAEFVLGAQEPRTIAQIIAESSRMPTLEEQMMLTDLRAYL